MSATKHRRPLWIVLGVAAAVVAAVLAVRLGRSDDARRELASGDSAARIIHVHGLGIDPADNQLYAATHTGLFRVDKGGKTALVGDSVQDTMGFTVVGPHHFLGSGHPDFRLPRNVEEPPLLGLIESMDAGKSWKTRSLHARADFHGLVFAHGLVYGWNATVGEFVVSSNMVDWEVRSPKVQLVSFAVDPADGDRVVGSGSEGLATSDDGGRTWRTGDGPKDAFLSWDARDGLWAAQYEDGAVLQSADGGHTWDRRGTLPGAGAEALLVSGKRIYAAAHDAGIFLSNDNGRTWTALYRTPSDDF